MVSRADGGFIARQTADGYVALKNDCLSSVTADSVSEQRITSADHLADTFNTIFNLDIPDSWPRLGKDPDDHIGNYRLTRAADAFPRAAGQMSRAALTRLRAVEKTWVVGERSGLGGKNLE